MDRRGNLNHHIIVHYILTIIVLIILICWIFRHEYKWGQVTNITDSVQELIKKTEHIEYGLLRHEALSEQKFKQKTNEINQEKKLLAECKAALMDIKKEKKQ